jgi:hypothetical protein
LPVRSADVPLHSHPGLVEIRTIPAKKDIAFVEFADEGAATVAKDALHNFKIDGETKMKVSGANDNHDDGGHLSRAPLYGTLADRQSCSGHVCEEVGGREGSSAGTGLGKGSSRWAGRCHRMFICIMHCVKKEKCTQEWWYIMVHHGTSCH